MINIQKKLSYDFSSRLSFCLYLESIFIDFNYKLNDHFPKKIFQVSHFKLVFFSVTHNSMRFKVEHTDRENVKILKKIFINLVLVEHCKRVVVLWTRRWIFHLESQLNFFFVWYIFKVHSIIYTVILVQCSSKKKESMKM